MNCQENIIHYPLILTNYHEPEETLVRSCCDAAGGIEEDLLAFKMILIPLFIRRLRLLKQLQDP